MHLGLNYMNKSFMGIVLIPEKDELWITNSKEVWCESRSGAKKYFRFSKNKNLQDMTIVIS